MSYNRSLLSQITKDLNKKPSKPKVPKNQWQHPGEITNIPSNSITMDAVSYPVLGVPNVGQPQMMYPDQQYYYPDADNVTEYPMMGSGGYVVTRSNDRKGKTHKVTGPDGTVKYFGDSSMGQHPKDPERKKAFYARHKKNLENNPFFRAFARKTWAEGGQTSDEREMVNGIADILSQVDNEANRERIARKMMQDFARENVTYDLEKFKRMSRLQEGGEEPLFNNTASTDQAYLKTIDNYKLITKNDVNNVRSNMAKYMSSPLYAQRQANYPENYLGDAGSYQKRKFENAIAQAKQKQRLSYLQNTPYQIASNEYAGSHFDNGSNKLFLNNLGDTQTIAHETGHSIARNNNAAQSDYLNGRYWDSIVNKQKLPNFSTGLNQQEVQQFVDLARPLAPNSLGVKDPHDDKTANPVMFSQESYGDLMGVRELLHKKGYTKNFGDNITKELMDRAVKDKNIYDDFIFRRMHNKYGTDNLIHLNNTIAYNNTTSNTNSMARYGGSLDYYQGGGEMIRRADGSYSRRGLWDNIRANKGSGKKPTKEMLEQERKIKSKMQFGGLWDSNRTAWVDSVNNANMDKNFVQRMYNPNAPQMFLPGSKKPSTHFMESGDARAYPTVVQRPGNKFVEWLNQIDPRAAYNYAMDTGQYIQFPNDEQATWYGANGYKQGTNVVTGKQKKQYGGVMKKYQKAGQVRSKDGYIDIAKIYPEVGDNTIDKDWVEKAEMLNKMYPNSRFVCTAKGCADIATSFARAKGYDFGRNHAWLLGNQNPVVWTNPNYEGMIESDRELLPNPTSYAVPEYLQSLDAGYLVGLNRINNSLDASGRKAKGKAARATSQEKSNDSGDYGPRLYPGSRKYEHTGYINEPGQLVHGTGAGSGHPSYLVFDNMKNGIQLNGIGKYEPVEAMEEASWFNKGINWLKNLQQGGSIYDYMTQRGLNASFANRKKMFDQYFNGNYTGTADQNLKMMQMLQGQQQRFQQVRPNVAFPTPGVQAAVPFRNVASASRRMPPVPKGMQRVTNKIDNRNWLYKLLNINEDEVRNTDIILPQDVAGYYNQYHDTNKGKKFGIVSKQNSRGYFFDEDGNLVLQDEVGLGSDAGDAQPIFYKVRTTPSGEYKVTKTNKIGKVADIASQYGSNNFFTMQHIDPNKRLIPDPKDPNRAVTAALHGVPVALEKQRLPLFGDNNVKNNRMSAGCINCRKSTLNKPYFTNIPYNQGMSLYVTPDRKHGGQLSLGQEIDVTPEEMFELKRQGYTFDII